MAAYKKIPLLKAKVDINATKRNTNLTFLGIVFLGLVVIVYIWMKVHFDVLLTQNQQLEIELRQLQKENEKLRADVVRLSSFSRIKNIAGELGMVPIPHEELPSDEEEIEEISQKVLP